MAGIDEQYVVEHCPVVKMAMVQANQRMPQGDSGYSGPSLPSAFLHLSR